MFKVNQTAFTDCIIPPANEALTTGNDEIVLAGTGGKWYICGFATHCATGGQKLAISVVESAPEPAPSSAVRGIIFAGYEVLVAAIIAVVAVAV